MCTGQGSVPCPKLDFGVAGKESASPPGSKGDQAPSLNPNKMNSVGNVGQQVRAAGSARRGRERTVGAGGSEQASGVRRAGAHPQG